MPSTKNLGSKYREAYESGADSLPTTKKKKKKKRSGSSKNDDCSVDSIDSVDSGFSIGSDDISIDNNEYDYSYAGTPTFEATAKERAMKRHIALEQHESKLSKGARKNLLKRRLMEERRNLRIEYAIQIQSFVRGAVCRHRVGIMVAELIDELEAAEQAATMQSSSELLPFDEPEPDDDDMSIDEAIYKQYLTELAATEDDDDDDNDDDVDHRSLNTNESGEVIGGLRFPSSLHEINLDDLSSDGSDGGSFGGDDEENSDNPFDQRRRQQQQTQQEEPNVPSIASRVGIFNNANQQKVSESPFAWTKQKSSKIGSSGGGVMAAASMFEKKQQPLQPPPLPKEKVTTKTWKPPAPAPAVEPSSEGPSTPISSAKASISFGASVNTFLSPTKFVTTNNDSAIAVTSPKPNSNVKPSSIADRVKRFNMKQEEKEDHELDTMLSPRSASPRKKKSSSRSGSSLDQLRNKFVLPTEKEEEPKSKNSSSSSSRPSLQKKDNSIRDLASRFDRPEKKSSKDKKGKKKDGTAKNSDKRSKQKEVTAPVEDTTMNSELSLPPTPSSADVRKSINEIDDNDDTKSSVSESSSRANSEEAASPLNQSSNESNEIQTSTTSVESNTMVDAADESDATKIETLTEVSSNRASGGESTVSPTPETKDNRSDQEPEIDKTKIAWPAESKESLKDESVVVVDYDDIDDEATAPETVDDNTATDEGDDGMVEELFLHFSATQIQALVRGYLFRKNVERDNSDDETEEESISNVANYSLTSIIGKGPSVAERQYAFKEKKDTGSNHRPSKQSSTKFKARQEKRKKAAITIQALGRGFLVRKVDYTSMMTVIDWLEGYKPRKDESDPVDEQFAEAMSEWVENVARGTANMSELPNELTAGAKKIAIQNEQKSCAATKIQALARGYIHRKFDAKSMMDTLNWLEDIQEEDTPPEPTEPKVKKLEAAWSFLQENNAPPKKPEPQIGTKLDEKQQLESSTVEEEPPRRTNVKELLGTWEWLKKADNRVTKAPKTPQPSEAPGDSARKSMNKKDKNAGSPQSTQTSRPKISELIQFYSWLEESGLESGISGVADESYESIRSQARNDVSGGVASQGSRGVPGKIQSPFISGGVASKVGKAATPDKLLIASRQKANSDQLGGMISSKSSSKNTKFNSLISLWGWLERNDMDMDVFRSSEGDAGDEYLEEDAPCALRKTADPQTSGDGVQYFEEDGSKGYGAQKWKKPVQPGQISGRSRAYDEPRKGDGVQYLDEDAGTMEAGQKHEEGSKACNGPRWKKPEQPVPRHGESGSYEESRTSDGVRYLDDEECGSPEGGKNGDKANAYVGPRWKKPEKPGDRYSDRTYEQERTGDGVRYLDDEDGPLNANGGPRWKKPEQPGDMYSDRKYEEQPTGDGVQYLDDEDGSNAYGGPRWKKPEQPGDKYSDRRYEEQPTGDGVQYLDDEDGSNAYRGPKWKKPEEPGDKYKDRAYEEERKGDGVQYLDDEDGSRESDGRRWKKPERPGDQFGNHTYEEERKGDGVQYLDDEDGSNAYGGPRWKKPEHPGDRFSNRTYEDERKGDGVEYLDEKDGSNPNDHGSNVYGGPKWKKPEQPGDRFSNRQYEEPRTGAGVQYLDEDESDAYGGPKWKKPEHPGDRFSNRTYEEPRTGDGVQYLDEKPTMEAMVNYWNFSAIHADNHDSDDVDNQTGKDGDEKISASMDKAGEPALANWVEEPLKNDMLNTLSWMDKQGVDLGEVKAEDVADDSETLSESLPEKDDMLEMMNWLNKRGIHRSSEKSSETEEDPDPNTHVSESTNVLDASGLPSKSGAPDPSDMANALRWLQRRGFNPQSSSKDATSGESNDGDAIDALDSKDVVYELSWLKNHGFDLDAASKNGSTLSGKSINDTKTDDKSSAPSATEMMNALSFLDKLTPKSPSKRKKSSSSGDKKKDRPSEETAAAIEWLQARGVSSDKEITASIDKKKKTTKKGSKKEQETTNSSHSKSKLSSSEMESALSWLTKKGFNATKKPKKSAMPSSQNMEAAVRLAKSKPQAVKKSKNRYKRPSVEDMEKALAFVKICDNPKPRQKKHDEKSDNNDEDMPSWKKKLLGAKKKIFEQDGEKRPDWLQKRVDIVNRNTKPLLSNRPPPPQHQPEESVPTGKAKATKEIFESGKKKEKKSQRVDTSKQSPNKHFKKGVKNSSHSDKKSKKVDQASKKENEKKDITKTLNWLTSKALVSSPKKNVKQSVQLMSPKGKKSPGTRPKRSTKPREDMSQEELDYENALDWLTTKRADSVGDIRYFKKLDAVLPKRENQSVESRAKQMAKAMKWVKKQEGQKGVEKRDVPKPSSLPFQDHLSSSHRNRKSQTSAENQLSQSNRSSTSGASSKDKRRNRKKNSEKVTSTKKESDDTAVVKSKPVAKGDKKQLTPKVQDYASSAMKEVDDIGVVESEPETIQTREEDPVEDSKKKRLDTAAVRSKQENIDEGKPVKESKREHDDPVVAESKPTKEQKSPKPKREAPVQDPKNLTQGEIDLNNAIAWLSDKQNDSLQDAKYFKKLDSMLPLKPGQPSDERAKDMAKALRWVKKSSARQNSANQEKGKEEQNQQSTSSDSTQKAPSPSETDVKNALAWISNKRNNSLEDAKYFKKLDSMLPEKPGQSDEQRAKDLAKALHWVKKTSGKQGDEVIAPKMGNQTTKNTSKMSRNVVSASILQDRDTANALKWLSKQGGDVSVSDAASFKKLDEKLPIKKGQSREDRAVEMAKALKLMRKRAVDSAKRNSTGPEKNTKDQSPKTELTPAQQIENATKFLTASSNGKDASQIADAAYFRKLDNMIPKRPNQTTEARAQEMVKMLGWMKKKGKI